MTKHTRKKMIRSQKGGAWYNPISWFDESSSEPVYPTKSITENITDAFNSGVNLTQSKLSDIGSNLSSLNPFGSNNNIYPDNSPENFTANQSQVNYNGGKKKRYARSMKGGKGGLGLTYYASPVSGLKVSEPKYWIGPNTNQLTKMGGSRKRKGRKTRRTRRHKKR